MKITTELLQSIHACQSGIDLVATYEDKDHEAVVRRLVADDHWDWANWLLPRLMDYKGYVSYAVYAAELVLPIYEEKYPDDKRPRKAIEAAKRCIDDPSKKNKEVAEAARLAAATWSAAAWAEAAESRAAADSRAALVAAADSRAAATRAARLAAASEAAWAAREASAAAENLAGAEKIKSKIIEKGLEILKK